MYFFIPITSQELQKALGQKHIGMTPGFAQQLCNSTYFMRQGEPHKSGLENAMAQGTRAFGRPPQIIFVLFPTKDTRLYPDMKRVADCELGVLTQVGIQSSFETSKS